MSENLHSVFRVIAIAAASLGAVAITSATPSHEAHASTSIAATVDDLARSAEIVARVTPLDAASAWEGGRIVTVTRVRVDSVVAGAAGAAGSGAGELRIRTRGGIVGEVGQYVEGEATLEAGKPALVFLASETASPPNTMHVVGRAQGRWLVARSTRSTEGAAAREVVRVKGLGNVVPRRAIGPVAKAGKLATELDGAPVEDATREIVRAWSSTHAR